MDEERSPWPSRRKVEVVLRALRGEDLADRRRLKAGRPTTGTTIWAAAGEGRRPDDEERDIIVGDVRR